MTEAIELPDTQDDRTVLVTAPPPGLRRVLARAPDGRYLPVETGDLPKLKRDKRKTQAKRKHQLTERDYLRAVTRMIKTDDIREVVGSLLTDAIDGDEKCRNAAREWLGKYVLGNGKESLDLVLHPEVIRGKR